ADKQRVPLSRPSTYRSTAAGLLFALVGGIAGLAGCAPARLYAEEPKVQTDAKDYVVPKFEDWKKTYFLTEEKIAKLEALGSLEKIASDTDIIKEGKVQFVKYDAKTKKNDFNDLVAKGSGNYVVLFGSMKNPQDAAVIRRAFIQLRAMASEDIHVIYFDMDADPGMAQNNYNTFSKTYGVKSVCSMALMQQEEGEAKVRDLKNGGPGSSAGVLGSIYNGLYNWARTVLLGWPDSDGKKQQHKYNGGPKLEAIANK
ncbi:MAG: hypothetical protein AABY01_00280, partial [Nanoarchaeota archaeon]